MSRESLNDFRAHFRELVAGELPHGSRILMPRGGGTLTIFATRPEGPAFAGPKLLWIYHRQ